MRITLILNGRVIPASAICQPARGIGVEREQRHGSYPGKSGTYPGKFENI